MSLAGSREIRLQNKLQNNHFFLPNQSSLFWDTLSRKAGMRGTEKAKEELKSEKNIYNSDGKHCTNPALLFDFLN